MGYAIDTSPYFVLERPGNGDVVLPFELVPASYERADRGVDVPRDGVHPHRLEQVLVELGQVF
jgi:hypothetical protein